MKQVYSTRLFLLFLLLFGWGSLAQAQPTYGNEWIVQGQQYYKIGVTNTGIHRLTYNWLTTNVPGVASVNPQHLKLYRRGRQLPIFVQGEFDGQLNPADYLEFYGERNDGQLDEGLYRNPAHHKNPYYSMFTDTAAYFLTWSAVPSNRMVSVNPPAAGLTPEAYHIQKSSPYNVKMEAGGNISNAQWPTSYQRGLFYPAQRDNTQQSFGDESENWSFGAFAGSRRFRIDSLYNVPTGADTIGLPKPVIRLIISSNGDSPPVVGIDVSSSFTANSFRTIASNLNISTYRTIDVTYEINFKDIAPASSTLPPHLYARVSTGGTTANFNTRVVTILLTYPQKFDLAGKSRMIYPDPNKPVSLLQVENPPANAFAYDMTDPDNYRKITGTVVSGGTRKNFVFNNNHAGGQPKVYIASGNSFLVPDAVQRIVFANISASDVEFILISHKSLMQPVAGVNDPVQAYADYRASMAGGNYKSVVAEIEQVYNQFHYGEKSGLAIKNYLRYMKEQGSVKNVLLVGKGLLMGYDNCLGTPRSRFNPDACFEKDLVPTFGYPGSDLAFVMDFRNNNYVPHTPIGRITPRTPQQVFDYLEKVMGHEAQPVNQRWRKHLLHVSGGKTPAEINLFFNYMNRYKAIAEGIYLGGRVFTRRKTDLTNPVQFISVANEVNAGVTMLSFFGHSGLTITDLDIGLASNPLKGYNNKNKYPFLFMLGCATGNAYTGHEARTVLTFGEDWLLTKDKGAVIFMAHADLGYTYTFDRFADRFYTTAFKDSVYFGKPLGDIHKETIRRYTTDININQNEIALLMQMNLQGDPAIRLYNPEKPDYDVTQQPVTLTSPNGGPVTATLESFRLSVPIINFAKAIPDSINVTVKRTMPNQTVITESKKVGPVLYNDTIHIALPSQGALGFGLNTFEVKVDDPDLVDELNENNNTATLQYFVPLAGVTALYPLEYSIVSTQQVTLKGQSNDMFSTNRRYLFEIDTSYTFTSSWKQTSPSITADLLPTWQVNLLSNIAPNDSIVYYWRVRFADQAPGEDIIWSTSSFVYIPNSPAGWAQSHWGQYKKNRYQNIRHNDTNRKFEFEQNETVLFMRTVGDAVNWGAPPHGIQINNEYYHTFNTSAQLECLGGTAAQRNRILLTVLHPRTLLPVNTIPGPICGQDQYFYTFKEINTAAARQSLTDFLNAVPNGYYVVLSNVWIVNYADFDPALRQAFASIGSTMINTLPNGYPYLLVGRKGGAAVMEKTADPASATPKADVIEGTVTLNGAKTPGMVTSTVIGPAYSWGTLFHTLKQVQATDKVKLTLIGQRMEGQDSIIVDQVNTGNLNLVNIVNAQRFPYLKLQLSLDDTVNLTPAQLKRWIVTYTPAPEGTVRPDLMPANTYTLGTKEVGERFPVKFNFQNISDVAFRDSVTARVELLSNGIVQQPQTRFIKLPRLEPGATAQFEYEVNTAGLAENNQVRVFVNPRLQPEQYFFNNVLEAAFRVRQDRLHPILDVVFDGVRIMDGDIVSPSPNITISMKDENKFRFKDDTVGVELFLVKFAGTPQEVTERINLQGNSDVRITYATPTTDFKIEYNPKNLPDGVHMLMVQGADKAGNVASSQPYRVRFEVINESQITHFYPYPNPFSNSAKFVFTLTGSRVPEQMKIQILTVTGKVVREITRDELGQLRIGVNGNKPTDFSWDGTDEYGDKLANGVYLYRVVIGDRRDDFKHRSTAGDKAFTKNYGKLYILR